MELKELENFIERLKDADEYCGKLRDLGIDIYETPVYESVGFISDIFLHSHLTDEGVDSVYWWIYQDDKTFSTKDHRLIVLTNVEELYNFLKSEGYIK